MTYPTIEQAEKAAHENSTIRNLLNKGYEKTGIYEYVDQDGKPHWRIRLDPSPNSNKDKWIRPLSFDGEKWVLKEPEFNGKKPLYKLQVILQNQDVDFYIVVEGEPCVDALIKLDLVVTTSGGANSAGGADWCPLEGKKVRIWRDNDTAGLKYAQEITKILQELGCTVFWIDIEKLNLPSKGDCVDWLVTHPNATKEDIENLPLIQPIIATLTSKSSREVMYRCMANIEAKPIKWLWNKIIAFGKVTIIAGNPGLGKSQLTANIAAIVTIGGIFPNTQISCPMGKVIFLSSEDDASDTIRPRLEAAGAELSRVFILDSIIDCPSDSENLNYRHFNLGSDLKQLEALLEEIKDVKVIVIDPISAYLGNTDSHKNAEVRALLSPLGELASKYGVAIICISHLNKSTNNDALMRVTGSLAFVAAARAAFLVVQDPDDNDKRLFLSMKNNIGKDTTGFAFKIESHQLKSGIDISKVIWLDESVTTTINDAMTAPGIDRDKQSALEDAKEFLLILLANAPVAVKEIEMEAENAGLSMATVRRAKKLLGISVTKDGLKGGWFWTLSPKALNFSEDAHEKNVSTFGNNERLRENTDD
jgi:putative DNA primase/helicase